MKFLFKKSLAVMLAAIMSLSFAAFPVSASAAMLSLEKKNEGKYAKGEAIVVLENTAGSNYLKAANASALYGKSVKIKKTYSFTGKSRLSKMSLAVLKSDRYSTEQLVRKLRKNRAVKYAFANSYKEAYDITADEYSKYQWALENTGQNGGTTGLDVNAEGLWSAAEGSEKEQIIAVVDTGFDFTHPDLKDIAWTNTHGSKLLGKHGYDFSNGDTDPQDDNGHGTHCAGIIAAAADNNEGISGISKSHTKIMPLKWLDEDGGGFTEDVLSAYEYINRAIDLGENVVAISNSWGGMADEDELHAFEEIFNNFGEKGVISLVAAGNESTDITDAIVEKTEFLGIEFEEKYYISPASCQSPYSLTVAATNENDELAGFSNYSDKRVDVAAPGCDILSSVSFDCFNPSIYSDEKKAAVVSQFQDFDGTVTSSDLGYPKMVDIPHEDSKDYFSVDFSSNATVAQLDKHFGDSGKSLAVITQDEIEQPEDEDEDKNALLYCFEIPYTIPDADKNYSVSFMASGSSDCIALVNDVPADFEVKENLEDMINGPYSVGDFGGEKGSARWSHVTRNFDVSNKSLYKKSTDRKIVVIAQVFEKNTELIIDDFAVSTQGIDTAEFGKYDFYNGTSMATPFVAGAVALLKNAFPDATARDVINMIKNTGRSVEGLKDKVESGKVLSLDNTDKTPPMLFNAKYDEKGNVVLEGSFKDVTSVKADGKTVKPTASKQSEIVLPDSSYNTKKVTFTVDNAYGTDTYTGLLSRKKLIEKSDEVEGEPMNTSGGFMLPAGDKAYYISSLNTIGSVSYDSDMGMYMYDEFSAPQIDVSKLFETKNDNAEIFATVTSAVYSNEKIFFTAVREIVTSGGAVIGYDNAFGYTDITGGDTVKLCELPDEAMFGSSLAAYNGNIYLAGGIDEESNTYSDAVYLYNTSKKVFAKQSAKLPTARAYTSFLQYGNKLYGVYGAQADGNMPAIICFDGAKWSASKVKFDTDDFNEYPISETDTVRVYRGNLGIGKNGLFLNGVYLYGFGDTYDYDVSGDKLVASAYSAKNTLDGVKLIGTTLPGCFIGYEVVTDDIDIDDIDISAYGLTRKVIFGDEDIEPVVDDFTDDFDIEPVAYKLNTATAYAKVTSSVKNAKVKPSKMNVAYGDTVTVKVTPKAGYAVQSISANGKVASINSEKATVRATAAKINITASVKYVAPAKVKGVKAKVNKKNPNKVTVSWKRAKKAKGYQVQQYKKGRWKTVKTIKKAKKVKCTLKAKKGAKFRVRAFGKYNKKTYYGKWSKAVKAK
ncbi:MAG: S8 family serine peptidase [Eubacterium sp.]|nr:S8 family serine peptidase [Eubacterium sp.]